MECQGPLTVKQIKKKCTGFTGKQPLTITEAEPVFCASCTYIV